MNPETWTGKIWVAAMVVLLAGPIAASAELELSAKILTEDVHDTKLLGTVEVPGLGKVSLVAERRGTVIEITAIGPSGAPIGRSETTVGLSKSPIYVRTLDGLTKISVVWNSPD